MENSRKPTELWPSSVVTTATGGHDYGRGYDYGRVNYYNYWNPYWYGYYPY